MEHKLINVSNNSNIEINDSSLEMLLHGVCKSFECEDFRANNCRMKIFLDAIKNGTWEWSETWMTPTKFFLHLIKFGDNSPKETLDMLNKMKDKWNCMESPVACECNFFDEMKRLKSALEAELNTK